MESLDEESAPITRPAVLDMSSAQVVARVQPLLDGDYSDPDVIVVDGVYWMIVSTIHMAPGMAVLRSDDGLQWKHVGHVVQDLTALGSAYGAEHMGERFGRGIYAGSIRHHDGRFLVHFTTLDEGVFVCTATDPAGPWSAPHLLTDEKMWDDPCPLWDDDGRAWLAISRPGRHGWFSYLVPMAEDGSSIDLDARRVVDATETSEGNKLYLRDGWIYLLHNEVRAPGDRVAVIMRARHIDGPWEKRLLVMGTGHDRSREPNQGALVEDLDGDWWFITHHGRCGYADGRPLGRLPIAWVDGWPCVSTEGTATRLAIRDDDASAIGSTPDGDDDFDDDSVRPHWEWPNQPASGSWQIDGARSTLRLLAGMPARGDGLRTAATVFTQRIHAAGGIGSVRLDVSALREGDIAGLGYYSTSEPVGLGVRRRDGELRWELVGAHPHDVGQVEASVVEIATVYDRRPMATFSVRELGVTPLEETRPLGDSYPLRWGSYRGSRIAVFAYNDHEPGGTAAFSRFRHRSSVSKGTHR